MRCPECGVEMIYDTQTRTWYCDACWYETDAEKEGE